MPCSIAFAPDLTALDREEVEMADWSDERDDLVDDLAEEFIEEWGIRRMKK